MPDYKNGKIYCIRSHQTPDIYIGSTVQKLNKRIGSHREKYKKWLNKIHHYTTSFELVKYDDCYIELLEDYSCENKEQLHKKEGQYIREMDCVNKRVEGRTKKEYQQENKEKLAKYIRQYQQTIGKEKITCECGNIVTKNSLSRHKKTIKHQKFLNN